MLRPKACLSASALCAFLSLVLIDPCQADTVSLRPIADTFMQEAFPDNNLGGGTTLASGGRRKGGRTRGLLLFDIAGAIPAGATVTAASLTVTVTSTPGGGADSIFDLNRVLAPWGEGDGDDRFGGTSGAPNQATWNDRLGPGTPWATPGGDFSSTISGSRFITGNGVYIFASTPNLVGDIQAWLANPTNNFGWVLLSELESTPTSIRRFGSREDLSTSPTLAIQFTVPEPGVLPLACLGLGMIVAGRKARAR
jgi:hypothetical protein